MADGPTLLEALAARPGDPAWIGRGGELSRGSLAARAEALALRLRLAGWRPGHRLAFEAAPRPACAVLAFAALAAGLDLLALPLRDPPARRAELAGGAGSAGVAGGAEGELEAFEAAPPAPAGDARFADGDGPRGRLWIRSSGTLGRPRWTLHGEAGLLAAARAQAERLDFGPGAAWELSLPLDHVGGLALLVRAAVGGGALLEPGAGVPSHLSLVAVQLRRRLASGGADPLRGLRALLLGGGPLEAPLRRRALEAGLPLAVSYGLSETAALLCVGGPGSDRERLMDGQWAGRPLWPDSLRVDGEGGLLVRAPSLCVALADDAGRTRPAPLEDGWLATGDLARLHGDGSLSVAGRRDLVIQSGGEKLPAEELEAALLELPGVLEALVVPLEDADWGQRPGAFLLLEGDAAPDLAELRAALASRLASWKLPVAAWSLPRAAGLKPDRTALRRLAAEWIRGERRP